MFLHECCAKKKKKLLFLHTFDKPLAVPIDGVVSGPISHIAWWSPQDLPVALAISCLATMQLS